VRKNFTPMNSIYDSLRCLATIVLLAFSTSGHANDFGLYSQPERPNTTEPKSATPGLEFPTIPSLASRLDAAWLSAASRIQTGELTIYYYGTAQGDYSGDRSRWFGTVSGDILYITLQQAIVCPKGTVTLKSDFRGVSGFQRSTDIRRGEVPPWRHLLAGSATTPAFGGFKNPRSSGTQIGGKTLSE